MGARVSEPVFGPTGARALTLLQLRFRNKLWTKLKNNLSVHSMKTSTSGLAVPQLTHA